MGGCVRVGICFLHEVNSIVWGPVARMRHTTAVIHGLWLIVDYSVIIHVANQPKL